MAVTLQELLIKKQMITPEQLEKALKQQKNKAEFLGTTLIKMGFVKPEDLLSVLSEQLGIPLVKLKNLKIEPKAIEKLPAKFAWHYKIIATSFKDDVLTIATCDPLQILNDVKLFLGCQIQPVLATEDEITEAIRKYYGLGAETVEGIIAKAPKESEGPIDISEEVQDIEKLAEDASVIKLVNQIILEACQKRATDIHIEPRRDEVGLRYRIDGILYEEKIPQEIIQLFPAIISRIKIMAKLNIVERRTPQDGRVVIKIGAQELDLRISIVPTRYGEEIVIRILPTKMLFSLQNLGFEKGDLNIIEALIKKPHGIIFVTGPTGSGKTTTLYASLNKIKSTKNKIITIEDPIEYQLSGISQVQVVPEIGFTFAQGLRSLLRHDPDIMMLGEVRDFETAELAIRIALTGHLVFSTLHTNDAAGGVTRLMDIGIEPYLISSSVEAFIAQRLVRFICNDCKEEERDASDEIKHQIVKDITQFNTITQYKIYPELMNLKVSDLHIFKSKGCEACNFTGFKDRTAIYEILQINKDIRTLVLAKSSADQIRDVAIKQGMKTLRIAGWKKVIDGATTPDEVIRVTQIMED